MSIRFKELSTQLNLNVEHDNNEQLQALEHWCYEHISRDIRYFGNVAEKRQSYLSLAKYYLDEFVGSIPKNSAETPKFDNLNVIQYAAYRGYDHYLNSLSLPKNKWDEATIAGMTPLHLAALQGHVHTVQVLLAKGANPNKENNNSQLPIHCALTVAIAHESDLLKRKKDIFSLLKPYIQDITHRDDSGNSILHHTVINGFYELTKELLEENPELAFCKNNYHRFPIHTAILNQQTQIAQLLLAIKKVATLTDVEGRVALHYAACYGKPDMVQLCCDATPDINIRDSYGKTPLILAEEAKNTEGINILITNGADATLTDFGMD
ncbi:Ankyrin repeat protein [Legionella lansingensis]|uniref:Ankyrin repeat protein n=1 Tax=Legionella lansingensis TaxID=45067 RepID=A0A0W0VFE0_9GAMM|nr:ankyrin repeat domain-containing protein [Legionella lansingensis]KTD18779.1 Ankyrin repeat protein [Legionella lansingensis]SNV58772.1 Ankyrin repeat protein [Legionella lansingensis]